ncbi:MAG: hypothetical protein PVG39_07270 [Desulfobacteraceae bacterium]|jgi:hypothetical protein
MGSKIVFGNADYVRLDILGVVKISFSDIVKKLNISKRKLFFYFPWIKMDVLLSKKPFCAGELLWNLKNAEILL